VSKDRVVWIEEVKFRMVIRKFQVCVIKSADRSDIAPISFKVIPKNTLTGSDQIRNDISTKVIQLVIGVIRPQHIRQQIDVEDVNAH